LKSGIDISVASDSDWFVYNEIFTNKEYDTALFSLLSSKIKVPLILDLGANVGYFTLKVADELKQAGIEHFRIVAVEASPSNYSLLKKRMSQQALKDRVSAYLGLAGYKSGSEIVMHSQHHYGHSAFPANTKGKKVVVEYLDIEKLINDTDEISFLKCDIEGSEEIFIKEYFSLLNRVRHAVFEFHARDCNVEHCRKMLSEAGLMPRGVIKEDPLYKTTVEIFSRS
jgi:FkbM family methyltransferase